MRKFLQFSETQKAVNSNNQDEDTDFDEHLNFRKTSKNNKMKEENDNNVKKLEDDSDIINNSSEDETEDEEIEDEENNKQSKYKKNEKLIHMEVDGPIDSSVARIYKQLDIDPSKSNYQLIEPSDLVTGSNVRAISEHGVSIIIQSILKSSWNPNTIITVTPDTKKNGKYRVIDGAHRLAAVLKLLSEYQPKQFSNMEKFLFYCLVLPPMSHENEMGLAFAYNETNNSYVKMNLFDKFYFYIEAHNELVATGKLKKPFGKHGANADLLQVLTNNNLLLAQHNNQYNQTIVGLAAVFYFNKPAFELLKEWNNNKIDSKCYTYDTLYNVANSKTFFKKQDVLVDYLHRLNYEYKQNQFKKISREVGKTLYSQIEDVCDIEKKFIKQTKLDKMPDEMIEEFKKMKREGRYMSNFDSKKENSSRTTCSINEIQSKLEFYKSKNYKHINEQEDNILSQYDNNESDDDINNNDNNIKENNNIEINDNLKEEIKHYLINHAEFENCSFEDYFNVHANDLQNKVQLFLADPPFNVLSGAYTNNNNRDNITNKSMEILVKMAEHFVKPGGTVFIFCTFQQASIYMEYLRLTSLLVEDFVMNIVNDLNYKKAYIISPLMRSMVQYAVVAHKKDANNEYVFIRKGSVSIKNSNCRKTDNVINGILPPENKQKDLNGNVLRVEEKSLELMGEIISRYTSNVNDIVFDPTFGTGASMVAGLISQRIVKGCDIDEQCVNVCKKRCFELIKHYLNSKQFVSDDITGAETKSTSKSETLSLEFNNNYPPGFKQLESFGVSNYDLLAMDLVLEKLVHVDMSSKINQEHGLYVNETVEKGNILCKYWGNFLDEDEKQELESKMYPKQPDRILSFKIKNQTFYIDGSKGCAATYANHPVCTGEKNAIFKEYISNKDQPYGWICIESIKTINKDEEIFVDYGIQYTFEPSELDKGLIYCIL